MNNENEIKANVKEAVDKELELKIYCKPVITKLGAMQRVTLGGSPGAGDTGGLPQDPFA